MDYSKLFKVFSDNNRIEVVKNLSQGVCCSCQFKEKFDISQPTLTYHLKLIESSGLATSKKDGTWNKYIINYEAIDKMIDFLKEIKENGAKECKC